MTSNCSWRSTSPTAWKRTPCGTPARPPSCFKRTRGVVIEGHFEDGVFVSDNLLVKHSEVYEPPAEGEPIDLEVLKDTLQ